MDVLMLYLLWNERDGRKILKFFSMLTVFLKIQRVQTTFKLDVLVKYIVKWNHFLNKYSLCIDSLKQCSRQTYI